MRKDGKIEWKLELRLIIFLKPLWYQEYQTLYTHIHIYITMYINICINSLQSSLYLLDRKLSLFHFHKRGNCSPKQLSKLVVHSYIITT